MARLPETTPDRYEPHFGADAPERLRVWAHTPHAAAQVDQLALVLAEHSVLPARLVELVRLRVAFHNQCRTCMASRYAEAGVTEDLVCSLERPQEAPDLTADEQVALAFADRFATDHLSVSDDYFAELRRHFTDDQVMELCFRLAYLVGFGRMMAILDVRPAELPDRFRVDGPMTPWGEGGVMERPAPPVAGVAARSS